MNDLTEVPPRVTDRARNLAALTISFFATVLAIISMGGADATKEAVYHNIQASNYYSFYQAKNIRQSNLKIAVSEIEIRLKHDPALNNPTFRSDTEQLLANYQKTIQRYESEPETKEGKQQLLDKAKYHEGLRDKAMAKDPLFDYSEAFVQIAIVMISVYIITGSTLVLLGGLFVGLSGIVASLIAFFVV